MQFENSNRVFILNKHGKPLMPCKPRKARIISECYTLFYALTVAILLIVTRMPVMIPAISMIIFNLIRARKE